MWLEMSRNPAHSRNLGNTPHRRPIGLGERNLPHRILLLVSDRLHLPQIGHDRLDVPVGHRSVKLDGHGRADDFSVGANALLDGPDDLFIRPRTDSRLFVGGDVPEDEVEDRSFNPESPRQIHPGKIALSVFERMAGPAGHDAPHQISSTLRERFS